MNINSGQFYTYKTLFSVRRSQATSPEAGFTSDDLISFFLKLALATLDAINFHPFPYSLFLQNHLQ